MEQLQGRVAVVTGAAGGIGRALAEAFAAEGMRVVLGDVEADALAATARELADAGHDVRAVVGDVSRAEDVEALAVAAEEAFGGVHVVCNNAGVVKNARSWDLTVDDWTWVLGVDLWSVVHGVRTFVPRLLAQGEGGHVVNTASMAALLPMPNLAAYGAAKAGVLALSESLAMELADEGSEVGVSVLAPGWVATGIRDSARNRPAGLADAAPAAPRPRTSSGLQARLTPADVAGQVLDAVRTKRFWVLTHDDYRPVIRERAAGIGTDAQPVPPPVW